MNERLDYADFRFRIDRGELRKGDIWDQKRREWLDAAEADDRSAQCEYACPVSADWDELGKDLEAGRLWYGRAAEQGAESAQYEYGLMLLNGEGGPVIFEEGRLWLETAAEAGFEDAARVLGQYYEVGALGFARNPELAAYWSSKVER